jgi:hypothetical protein
MKSVSLGFALVVVAFSALACRNPLSDESVALAVSKLDAPSSALPRTSVTVVLTVRVNGCERFDHISQMRVNSQIVLTAIGTNPALGNKDVSCPAVFTEQVHSVVIKEPPAPPFTVAVIQPRGAPPLRAEVALGAEMDQSFVFNVSKIDAPASIAPGTSLSVVLTAVSGGCARFDHIETQRNASGASITVWGVNPAIGNPEMACTADIRNEPHTVSFDPPFATTFTVSVNRPQLAPLTATVRIQ